MLKKFELFVPKVQVSLQVLKEYLELAKKFIATLLAFLFFITPLAPVFAQVDVQLPDLPVIEQPTTETPDVPTEPEADFSGILDALNNAPESQPSTPEVPDPTSSNESLNQEESKVPDSVEEPAVLEQEADANPEEENQPESLLSESQIDPNLDLNSGKNKTQAVLPDVDNSTGALTYTYPISVPPGRNGIQPNISLSYNNQKGGENSIAGYGWEISGIPYIERINKNGTDILYRDLTNFTSSISGELVASTTATSTAIFIPRIETGDFISYTYSSSTAVFIAVDKQGTTYTYGSSTDFRLNDPDDASRIFKWMISEIRDTNGNYVKFEYYKNQGQIYPQTITYTGNGIVDGPFTVVFNREAANYEIKSYKTGFLSTTAYRLKSVATKFNNATATVYSLAYTTGQNGNRQMLASVTETGINELGASVSLPPVAFTYQINALTSGDWEETSVSPPTYIYQCSGGGPDQYAGGVLWGTGVDMGDFNGDAISDVAISYGVPGCANPAKTYLGPNFAAEDQFIVPEKLQTSSSDDFNSRFLNDINGDGLADEVGAPYAYLNTGSGFAAASSTYANSYDPDDTTNWPKIIDLNGDGLADYYIESSDDMYRNNGTGFYLDNQFGYSPVFSPYAFYYADLNGDGLPDYIFSYHKLAGGNPEEWLSGANLNDGNGSFEAVEELISPLVLDTYNSNGSPSDTHKYTLADFNGDGLADIVGPNIFINTGDGWGATTTPPMTIDSADPRYFKVMDYNADGMPDVVHEDGAMWVSNKPVPDMLKKVSYPAGGFTDITYKSSYEASTTLPYVLQVVDTITTSDNASTTMSLSFTYADAYHYYATSTPLDRKFAGFGAITKTDSAGNYTKTYFHQGNGSDSNHGEYQDNYWKIGRSYRTEIYDDSDNLYKKIISKWDYATSTATSTAAFVKLTQTLEQDYDGLGTHKDRAYSYIYSDTNGNLSQKVEWGEVTGSDDGSFSDTGTDKFTTAYSYATSATTSITSLLSQSTITDQSDSKVKEDKYYYDNLAFGIADKGNSTKREMWKNSSNYIDTEKTYNSYGLVTQVKDPRDKATNYSYDSYNLYPSSVTNPVSQVTQYLYDYSSGKAATTTDPNGNIFVNVYDGLDRLLLAKQPNPSATSTLETKTAVAYTDTSGAVSVHRTDYLNSATSTESYIYLDGLNRKKQERAEAEGSNYAVKDYSYNNLGLLQKESLPYFSSGTASTTATSTSALYSNFTYDALKRATIISTAVGTTTNAFGNWEATTTDPSGNEKGYVYDAYGNLTGVEENHAVESTVGELYLTDFYNDANLVSYWRFEGNSADSKGSNNGTSTNITYGSGNGKFGQGALVGAAGKISLGNPANLRMDVFTINFWLVSKPTATTSPKLIWARNPSGDTVAEFGFGWAWDWSDNSQFRVVVDNNAGSGEQRQVGSLTYSSFNNGDMVTVVGNWPIVTVYINGVEMGSTASFTQHFTNNINSPTTAIGANGAHQYSATGMKIDDMSVFSRVLSESEIDELYNGSSVEVYDNYTTQYQYDYNRNLTKITDAAGNIRNFTYDGLGRRTGAEDLHASGDGTYGSFAYTYDDSGNLTQKVDPKSQTTNFTYDDINRVLTEDYTGAGGTEVTYTYDSCTQGKGRLCTASSTAVTIVNAYNALGQLTNTTSTISSVAYPTAYTYDRQGNQLTIVSPDGSSVKYNYNGAGQVETVQRKESTDGAYQDLVLDLDYGPHGKIIYQENANCTETTNTYDASQLYRLSRKVTITCYQEESLFLYQPPPGQSEEEFKEEQTIPEFFAPATPTSTPTSTKDSLLPTSTPDSLSTSTLVSYGEQRQGIFSRVYGALAGTISKITDFITQQFMPKTAFAAAEELYDTSLYNDSNLVSYWRFEADSNDSKGSNNGTTTNITYDAGYGKFGQGALVGTSGKISLGNPSNLRLDTFTINFWMVAKPTATTSPKLIWARNPNMDSVAEFGFGWAWDWSDNSQFRVVVDNNGGVGEQRQVGSLTYSSFNDGDMVTVVGDWPIVTVYINGANMGSTASFTQHFTNNYNSPTQAIGANGAHIYSATGMEIDDMAVFSRVLSESEISSLYTGILNIQDLTYTYDANGNITGITDASITDSARTVTYSYDDLNRLINASTTAATAMPYHNSYTYNALGNMLTRMDNGSTTTYTYATGTAAYLNPHAVATTTSGSAYAYTYDNNGNLLTARIGSSTPASSYTWDYNNRLTQAVVNGTATSTYQYDPWGQRTKQVAGATTTIYSSKFYNVTGSTPTKNIFLPDGTMIATVVGTGTSTAVSYVHTDHLGGVNVSTNDSGEVSQLIDYLPYGGKRIDEQSGADSTRQFIGEFYDDSTSLSYLNARYLNSNNAKFTSQDPMFWDFDQAWLVDPQSQNSYSYARNNPLVYIDPEGLDSYIFYDKSNFSKQAQAQSDQYEEQYNTPVHMVPVSTTQEFADSWNGMGSDGESIDGVSILFHSGGSDEANTISIDADNGQYLTTSPLKKTPSGKDAYYLGDLQSKEAKQINLLTCEGGNVNLAMNTAKFLAVKNKTDVYAWDGKVSFSRGSYLPRSTSPWSQPLFFSSNGRAPYGQVKYKPDGSYSITGKNINPYKWYNYLFDH